MKAVVEFEDSARGLENDHGKDVAPISLPAPA